MQQTERLEKRKKKKESNRALNGRQKMHVCFRGTSKILDNEDFHNSKLYNGRNKDIKNHP